MRWVLLLVAAACGAPHDIERPAVVAREPRSSPAVIDAAPGARDDRAASPVPARVTPPPAPPSLPPSSAPAIQLALGSFHSCALHADGLVSCWGENADGQLGDGTKEVRRVPVRTSISDVVELVAHGARTCARKRDRTMWCWGSGPHEGAIAELLPVKLDIAGVKQLAGHCALLDSGEVTCWETSFAYPPVVKLADATVIAVGGDWEACASRTNGKVACWYRHTSPRDIAGVRDAVGVAVGPRFACALHRGGTVSCWGDNDRGRLGRGTDLFDVPGGPTRPRLAAARVKAMSDAVALVAGFTHACVRTKRGKALCWGETLEATSRSRKIPTMIGKLAVTEIAAGHMHDCAITKSGEVLCWGANSHGQLGIGWAENQLAPTRVPGIADATKVVALRAVDGKTCALRRSGTVACWGDGDPAPRDVKGLTGVVQITGGRDLCVRKQDGSIACRKDGAIEAIRLPTAALDVDGRYGFACAVLSSGSVSCWGHNHRGQFGLASTSGDSAELAPQPAAEGIVEARAIALGQLRGCAILRSGGVTCWGMSTDSGAGPHDPRPVTVAGLADATQLALGDPMTCALRATGRVWCMGQNSRGELGNGTSDASATPTAVLGIEDAVQITARGESACARRATGQLACWGRNHDGQLGDAARRDPADKAKGRSTPALVPGISDAVDVSTSGLHTCAVLRDGAVMCWGRAGQGEVGTIASSFVSQPVPVLFSQAP